MNITRKIAIAFLAIQLLVIPAAAFAQNQTPPGQTTNSTGIITIGNPTNAGSTLMDVLRAILNNIIMPIAAVFVVMWIIYAGFTYVTAQGNPAKVSAAHQRLLWSLIGAGILLGAAAISGVVQKTIDSLLK